MAAGTGRLSAFQGGKGDQPVLTIRLTVTAAVWLIPGAAAAVTHRSHWAGPASLVLTGMAAAVTGAVLVDELRLRGGDDVYASCVMAVEDVRKGERAALRREGRGLSLVAPLTSGEPGPQLLSQAAVTVQVLQHLVHGLVEVPGG